VLNNEVGNQNHTDDNSSSPTVVEEDTPMIPPGFEVPVADAMVETLVVSEAVELEPVAVEVTSSEVVSMVVDVAPEVENRMILHEYPNAGIPFDPPFGAVLTYHQLVGGFSVPIGYATMYEKLWKMYGHMVVNRDPERNYLLTKQVEAVLCVLHDICTTPKNVVTRDVLLSWEYSLKNAEDLGFNLKWFRQKLDTIRKAVEGDVPFPVGDDMMKKRNAVAELTKKLEAEKAALKALEDAEKQKSFFDGFL
jgi:hypothetical protein